MIRTVAVGAMLQMPVMTQSQLHSCDDQRPSRMQFLRSNFNLVLLCILSAVDDFGKQGLP
jgi:hypothetical protein